MHSLGRPDPPSGMMTGVSTALADRLRRRIERFGPITFAEFMSEALYDPAEGFYERRADGTPGPGGAVGPAGDFVTSPHVSPLFGTLLARQIDDFDAALGGPTPFTVVEAGAGDGTLAEQIAAGLAPGLRTRAEFVLAERTARHRALAEGRRLGAPGRVVGDVGELAPASVAGCVLANELLDNLPFNLVRGTPAGLAELYVGLGTGGASLALIEGAVSSPDVERHAPPLRPGREAAVPTGALAFVEAVDAVLRRGYVLLIDYATSPGEDTEAWGGVHGYRRHGVVGDVLANPGSTDVTAGVDMGVVAARSRELGLIVWGPVTQRDALAALGFADELEARRRDQVGHLGEGRGTEAVRAFSARAAAGLLVERGGLGDFAVLCLGKGVDGAPPRCMAASRTGDEQEEGQVT